MVQGAEAAVGAQLGPYRLLAELGAGGMGTVFLAEVAGEAPDLAPGERVALKLVHSHLLDRKTSLKRFLREAEVGKAVRHPNVVRTLDAGVYAHGRKYQHYLVMEYVEGQTLRELVKELGRVPEALCRHIGLEMAKGLEAIHAAGVVHRDLKPENVLITREQVVKVMDLGVALLPEETTRLSQSGLFVGSLRYAAPEQLESEGKEIDGRADLHALGLVLYELSSGAQAFGNGGLGELVRRVMEERPRRLGELAPQVSPFFEEVVHHLLEKDRERRFGTAGEFLAVLEGGEEGAWWREREQAIREETRLPLRRVRVPRETALYGREEELGRLRALYERAKSGEGQVVLVEGEAGIGKTRLVDELAGLLEREGEDLNFLFGSYPPGGAATATGAFVGAYREQFGVEGLEETLERHLAVTPLLVPAFAALLRGDAPPKEAVALTKDSLQAAFVHVTRTLAAERPTVILIDDLHFAPEEGRALFSALALAIPGHRVFLVGTARPGLPEGWMAGITRLEHAVRLELPRLGAKDLERLLVDALHSEPLAQELAVEIATRSDGNPFFVFEILRGIREGHYITQAPDGTWMRGRRIEAIAIPSSVADLIRARIAELDEEDRELLEAASCCGFEFDPLLLAEALGLGRIPLLKRLARLEKGHRLVRAAGAHYVFDHHQVQEALYEGLAEPLRREYHAVLGEALERLSGAADLDPKQLDGAVAVDLANHLLRGGRGERAFRYLDAALDHLEVSYRNEAAIRLLERALAIPGLLAGPERVDVLLRKARPMNGLGRYMEAKAVLEEALSLADVVADTELRIRVRTQLGLSLERLAYYEEANTILLEAIDIARAAGKPHEGKTATGLLGVIVAQLGRYEEAMAHFERSAALARAGADRATESFAIGNLGTAFHILGHLPEAQQYLERNLALARESGNRRAEAMSNVKLGDLYRDLGWFEEARRCSERGLALGREVGYRISEVHAFASLANIYMSLGRSDEALGYHERQLTLCREIGYRRGEVFALLLRGRLLAALGDVGGAGAALETSRFIAAETGALSLDGLTLHALGKVKEQVGEALAAEALYRDSLQVSRGTQMPSEIASALVDRGGLLAGLVRIEEARTDLTEALALSRKLDFLNEFVLAAAQLALLPEGDPAFACQAFAEREARLEYTDKMMARFLLWKATGDRIHLEEAHRLLTDFRQQAPAKYRKTVIENVPLHREILGAYQPAIGSH